MISVVPRLAWLGNPARRVGRRRLSALTAVTLVFSGGVSLTVGLARGGDCEPTTVTAPVVADTWLDEDSPSATKGSDSVLDVDAGSLNVDTGEVKGRSRALLRFALPAGVPAGCVVESARLRVFSAEESVGTRVDAVGLAAAWTESSVSWSSQPATIGTASTIWSREGYMQWNVTEQVQAMLEGASHGFLLRDAAEASEAGGGHGFYGREKGENPAHVVIRFEPQAPDEDTGPPLPASPAPVSCGQELTQSTLVTNDLANCLGDGLVIGAPRIIVDLGGHTIDGIGLGSGIRNEGFASVTVRNGTIQEFDYGVQLFPETTLNVVELLTLRANQVAAVELFDVASSEIRENTLDQNAGGILLVSGTRGSVVADNTVTANGGAGLLLRDANDNRLEHNSVAGGGDLGIWLERASGNVLLGNSSSDNSDGGIEIRAGSRGNHVAANTVVRSGDHGILVSESDGTVLIGNIAHGMSDSGITLDSANHGVVRGNDVRFNTGGLQLDGSSRNTIEANNASETSGIGIELGGGSLENVLDSNTVDGNGAQGIYVADDATDGLGAPVPGLGNVLVRNTASANLSDGIVVAKGGHSLTDNLTSSNRGWGINAALVGTIDGGGNVAVGNQKPEQCVGVRCREEWVAPETTISVRPNDATASSSATFAFTGTDDTTPAASLSIACSLDGAEFVSCASPRSFTGLAHGLHTFAVRATDRAGNTDPTPATHAWVVDSVPPETTLGDRPPQLANADTAEFTFSGSDEGGGGSSVRFECRLDGAAQWTGCSSPSQHAGLTDGSHTFAVRATDAAGNADASPATYSWTVDTTAPQTTIESGPDASTNETSAKFSLGASEHATLNCTLDGDEATPCGASVTYTGLAEGAHSLAVTATDRAGNTDASPATYSWTVDTTPPETTVESGPADPTNARTATFSLGASEPSAFACALDGAALVACAESVSYSDLAEGTHTLAVAAMDAAGNADTSPATYTWIIDIAPPQTSIDDGPHDPTNSTSATFLMSASEAATFTCALDGVTPAPCEASVTHADLSEGSHTFAVTATDAAGNTDASAATHSWTVDRTPPETTIDSGPGDPTNATSATFQHSADEPATFACSLDGGDPVACGNGITYAGLAEGTHTFVVTATDAAGNTDAPATHAWTIDTTPPETTIDSAPTNPTNSASATFEHSANELATFACALDGAEAAPCGTSVTYSDLGEGTHSFSVVATDASGNTDASPATHTWTVETEAPPPSDSTPPQTTLGERPSDPTNISTARFTFGGSDDSTPAEALRFECRIDSVDPAAFEGCTSPIDHEGLSAGAHSFEARAVDAAGNRDPEPTRYTWTIDIDRPETTITDGPAGRTRSTSATMTFVGSDNLTAASQLWFTCSLDGADFEPCASPVALAGLGGGPHSFRVVASDHAGNADPAAAERSWTVDLAPPETRLTGQPANPSNQTSATFTFDASDDVDGPGRLTFECRLDAAAFASCTSPRAYSGLPAGSHTFEVRATDVVGNIDPSPARHVWTIDTTPPNTTITGGPAAGSTTTSTNASFTFTASETGSSFQCSLDSTSAYSSCTSPRNYAGLTVGSHTFRVRAIDAAGNVDATPVARSWSVQGDTTPPNTTITGGPTAGSTTTSSTASFTFTANETGSSFECSLDSTSAYGACTSPRAYTGLTVGAHTFRVRAIDAAGNVDATPASRIWTIEGAPSGCGQVTLVATADAWIEQNSSSGNKGSDSILKVKSQGPTDNFRALVTFALPSVPTDCVLVSATLRIYAASATSGRTLEAVRVNGSWTENGVTWNSQPTTTGGPATTASGSGHRQWSVTTHVQAMYDETNHGFLIRDSAEAGSGFEQQFHSREKGEQPPQLVLDFVPATAATAAGDP